MRTLRHAAALLADAHSIDTLIPIATELSFEPVPLTLDDSTRSALGIADDVGETRLVRGVGALRALLVITGRDEPLRTLFTRLANTLSSRAGSVLWLLIGASASGEVGIACWTGSGRAPRLNALVARRDQVVASDAESLSALAAAAGDDDLLTHTRWCELLGREALSRRFYRTLEQRVTGLADSLPRMSREQRSELALLAASRLLFLSFLETKGWLDGDRGFLARQFDGCMAHGGGFHQRVLLPLWFGTLNTPMRRRAHAARAFGAIPFLNGGLFGKTPLERRHTGARLSDESLGRFFSDVLGAYRFTAREDQERWTEAAIDPEMLGRAFESLMAARERRSSGAFYTPQALVTHVAEAALASRLSQVGIAPHVVHAALRGDTLSAGDAARLRSELATLTVLDPACGSGAFLVHLLERMAALCQVAGDHRAVAEIRREMLARAIHGVDVNPTAVWLCELRLWLSVVIESEETRMSAVPPLPNLDCNVRVGDALAGDGFSAPIALIGAPASLARLRHRYARATGPRKATLRRALDREERRRALAVIERQLLALRAERRERVLALRSVDLFGTRGGATTLRRGESLALRRRVAALHRERERIAAGGALPFAFASHFGHVHIRAGFALVVGNPPWVRLHNIPAAARASLRERFSVFRNAAWTAGADRAGAGSGFGAQVDLAALFVERSLALAAPVGVVALLVPAKLWRSLAGGGVRALLASDDRLLRVEDWSEAPCAFDAAVYPSVVMAAATPCATNDTRVAIRRRTLAVEWRTRAACVRFDADDPASPWLLMPPEVRSAFDRVAAHGRPLGDCSLGRPTLGVKCGCNEAFSVEIVSSADAAQTSVSQGNRHGTIEPAMLRPLVRGEQVAAWRLPATSNAIVWTHAASGAPLDPLPPLAARWLAPWRSRLSARSDLRGTRAWWSLFRTEAAACDRTRVVWCDFGRVPRAAVIPAGDPTVPLNSCYVLSCADRGDALAIAALLNSPLAAAWLGAIAEPARGGWHRYLAWTVSLLPLPHDWSRARAILAPIGNRAALGEPPTSHELLEAVCGAYRLKQSDVAPLLAWIHRP
ncbi:MAG TPA: DNA methyltransferase [Gemmatimonadaceae bacterium]|nr:DNA methyltransferase [Gemmatimonadaceae bacterium]